MKFKPKNEDTRNFLKLKAGETVTGIFRGELYDFRIHWADNRSTICPGPDTCEICREGNKSKFRFRVNFVVKEGEGYVAKVTEQGWTFYEVLRSLNEGDYPLEKYVMKITRHGERLNTTYTVIPAPSGLVSAELEKKLELVKLNDLGHITDAENEPPAHTDTDLNDLPF